MARASPRLTGVLLTESLPAEAASDLCAIQHDLFDLGAERTVTALGRVENVSTLVRQYLNRLSDLMFVLARQFNQEQGIPDVCWKNVHTSINAGTH